MGLGSGVVCSSVLLVETQLLIDDVVRSAVVLGFVGGVVECDL